VNFPVPVLAEPLAATIRVPTGGEARESTAFTGYEDGYATGAPIPSRTFAAGETLWDIAPDEALAFWINDYDC
jgi:hypothetical protein